MAQKIVEAEQAANVVANDPRESEPRINTPSISFQYLLEYDNIVGTEAEIIVETPVRTPESIIDAEICKYKSMEGPKEDCDILVWWKDRDHSLPLLAKLARAILAIPASSASAEANFSSAGFVVSDRRSQIDSSLLESILVCRNNSDLIEHN